MVQAEKLSGDLVIDLVHSEPEARTAADLLKRVWTPSDGNEPVSVELAWVFAHTRNYVAVASVGGLLVGAAVAFRAVDAKGAYLHSHIAGILPEHQGSSIGCALKRHQRSWALDEGFDRVAWTFDPLVIRNAYFNVMKLGAELTDYFVDFYGAMDDAVNGADQSDRCLVTWWLRGDRATAALAGTMDAVDLDALSQSGAEVALAVGADGLPSAVSSTADVRLLSLPRDIVSLRRLRPAVASQWRVALRKALQEAFADGLRVTRVTRDSHYVLARRTAGS